MDGLDDNQRLSIIDLMEEDVQDAPIVRDSKSCFKARYTFGFMGFLGVALVYAMRVSLAISIVSMINDTQTNDNNGNASDICPSIHTALTNGTIIPNTGEFNWDDSDEGIVLAAFGFGFLFTSIPGGRMAEKYGGKLVCGLGVFFTAVLSLISPFAARQGVVPFVVIRIAEGLASGVTFPAMQSMLAHWVPRLERSKFSATVYTGMNFGTVIALFLGGWLCSFEILGGWPLPFYLFGGLGIVWYVFWLVLVFDSPSQHPRIDPEERAYIEASIELKQEDEDNSGVPWRDIFTSVPMWAIAITQFGQTWWLCALLAELPTFMHKVLHFDMQQIAYLSMLPYLSSWLVGVGVSILADALLARKFWTLLVSIKFWNTISSIGPSLGFIGTILAGCNRDIIMAMLICFGSLQGIVYVGNQMNHIALAPRYVGTLYGITNAVSCIAGILAPYVFGCIIEGHDTLTRWHTTFWLAAGINISTGLFYLIFASAKEQPWR